MSATNVNLIRPPHDFAANLQAYVAILQQTVLTDQQISRQGWNYTPDGIWESLVETPTQLAKVNIWGDFIVSNIFNSDQNAPFSGNIFDS